MDLQTEERLLIVKQKEEEVATANPTFVFPEVQEAMQSMNQIDPKGSCGLDRIDLHCKHLPVISLLLVCRH